MARVAKAIERSVSLPIRLTFRKDQITQTITVLDIPPNPCWCQTWLTFIEKMKHQSEVISAFRIAQAYRKSTIAKPEMAGPQKKTEEILIDFGSGNENGDSRINNGHLYNHT